jgi:hypothetical protein
MGSKNDTSLNRAPWMYLANGATDPIYENRLGFILKINIKGKIIKIIQLLINIEKCGND